ncbi:GTPase ObgE [candidate division KSB1 bacterium]
MMFIDETEIEVIAGVGGSGCMSFHREKFVSKGGPNGGDGGKGGSVIFIGDSCLHTLMDSRYNRIYRAKRGQHGMGSNKTGKNGDDKLVKVPLGTVVIDIDEDQVIGEIVKDEQKLVVAKGGRGGRGNTRFASPTNQAPREWETGGEGEHRKIRLELKLLADIGLVGFPNAGKSTLISTISAAKPKIADYPFTTLIPNLGIIKCHEFHSFVMADIPGLIEGSHEGKGLGDRFLKHIERTKGLLFLIDIFEDDYLETYKKLCFEIEQFNKRILKRPHLIIITKNDAFPEAEIPEELDGIPVISISSVQNTGLRELKDRCCEMLKKIDVNEEEN